MGSHLRTFLEASGYRILERHHEWYDCLILGSGEVWSGSGADAEEAFERAARQCFPSAAALRALDVALGARDAVLSPVVALPSEYPTAANADPLAARIDGAAFRGLGSGVDAHYAGRAAGGATREASPEIGGPSADEDRRPRAEPIALTGEEPSLRPAMAAASDGDASLLPGTVAPLHVEPPHQRTPTAYAVRDDTSANRVAVPASSEPDPLTAGPLAKQQRERGAAASEEERSKAFDELAARIEARRVEVSLASPRRQRLVLLSWLAEARSWQSGASGIGIVGPVPPVVKTLRALTEEWWPGTIAAFQLHSTPASTRTRDLRGYTTKTPVTWREVAELAQAAVSRIAEEEGAAGWDEDGWADRAQTLPKPEDPEALLEAVIADVEAAGGPIDGPQPKGGELPPVGDLERWVRRTRWLRGATRDDGRWGRLAGRLRFWSQRTSDFTTASDYLDPGYRPPRAWASLFEAGEQRRQEAQTLERVIRTVPSSAADERVLLAWMNEALPLTGAHQNTILQACAGLHERILGVEEDQLDDADRRIRRRLQKLKQAIVGAPLEEPAPKADLALVEEPALENEAVPDELLALTRGKRAIFIGNRADALLQDRLVALLSLDRLEWSEATPRRVDAVVEAIASQTYDLVLGATGFMGHKYDGRLARACKGAGIPYVRADRGRPGAVVRALSRDLGAAISLAR